MTMREVLEQAKSQLSEVTGLKPVTVCEACQNEQGWRILLDMLEMPRIPTATDVLGEYEVMLDGEGNMLSFERKRTRLRGQIAERDGNSKA